MKYFGSLTRSLSLLLASAAVSSAAPIAIQIVAASGGGADFSWLHTADKAKKTFNGDDFWLAGSEKWALSGTLFADKAVSGNTVSITGVQGSVTGANGLEIVFNGGNLTGTLGGLASGVFNYSSLTLDGVNDFGAGAFHFFAESFTGPDGFPVPNSLSADMTQFRLWGNNWDNALESKPTSGAFGIDLGGVISDAPPNTVVPEPSYLIPGALLMGLAWLRKRRSIDA